MMTSPSTPAPQAPRRFARGSRLLHLVAVTVTLFVTLLLGLALLPNIWGWSSMVVTSGSMEPALSPGDVVLVEPRDASSLQPMDIITFMTEDGIRVTHRIVDVGTDADGTSFVTKGDANEEADGGVVDARNVEGRVHYSVPRVGYLIAWARTPLGFGLLALTLGYIVFGGRSRAKPGDAGSTGESADSSELVRS